MHDVVPTPAVLVRESRIGVGVEASLRGSVGTRGLVEGGWQ